MNIAVLASGRGTNFEAIARAIKRGYIRANLKLLITDKEEAYVRLRAKRFKIREIFINPRDYKDRVSFDKAIADILKKEEIDLVVLAGFMRILSSYFVKRFRYRILNIHPALLPSFKGTKGIEDAYNYGVKITGVTVHFVDEKMDHGPIILQEAVRIGEDQSLQELEKKIHRVEHRLYPLAIKLFCEGRISIRGRRVRILSRT